MAVSVAMVIVLYYLWRNQRCYEQHCLNCSRDALNVSLPRNQSQSCEVLILESLKESSPRRIGVF